MDLIILYFRDGVGEGQFNQVLNIELDQMVGGAPIEALGSDDTNEICVSKHRYIVC